MSTRPPKDGGHARRRWQARADGSSLQGGTVGRETAENNVVDLPAKPSTPEESPAYWIGWADGFEAGKDVTEGRFRQAMHQAGHGPTRPTLRVVRDGGVA